MLEEGEDSQSFCLCGMDGLYQGEVIGVSSFLLDSSVSHSSFKRHFTRKTHGLPTACGSIHVRDSVLRPEWSAIPDNKQNLLRRLLARLFWGRSAWSSYLSHHSLAFWKSFSHGEASTSLHSFGQ